MNLAIDTDALIKLTKSSSKSAVGKAFTVLVPPEVQRECVEQGKAGGFPDALRVEENVEKGVLDESYLAVSPFDIGEPVDLIEPAAADDADDPAGHFPQSVMRSKADCRMG